MSCTFSREMLALHVEGDLPHATAEIASRHLTSCVECRRFVEALRARQSLLKSLRSETVTRSECTSMRRAVMSIIDEHRDRAGWILRIERALVLGFQGRSYAMAAAAVVCLVSAGVLAQMRHDTPGSNVAAPVFEGKDTLLRPQGYRDWIFVAANKTSSSAHKVFINPTAYREYAQTGKFPEGTLMIWEPAGTPAASASAHERSSTLLASVKDSSRFDGGWGFFDFTAGDGTVAPKAKALPESRSCRTCHRKDAETDHVFTQFYPVLRSARHSAQLSVQRGRPSSPST